MRYLVVIAALFIQGCSVYGSLSTCDGFSEGGSACTPLIENLDYAKELEKGIKTETGEINYAKLDNDVNNDEFARLALMRAVGAGETDPILKPAKVVKATIYPYSDGEKFYQQRNVWIKTSEEEWIVGDSMVVDRGGTVMMGAEADVATPPSVIAAPEPQSRIDNEESLHGLRVEPAMTETTGNGDIVSINCFYLNVRSEPRGEIIGVVEEGVKLRLEGEAEDNWQLVTVLREPPRRQYKGWVDSTYLTGEQTPPLRSEDAQ